MREDHDPADTSQWPEEFLSSSDAGENETWSLVLIESGLKNADLTPLAGHLRKGFPLPPGIAKMIADAIERKPEAVCSITAKQSARGRRSDRFGQQRTDALRIGRIVDQVMKSAKNGEYDAALLQAASDLGIGRTKAFQAHKTFLEYVREMAREVEATTTK